MRFKVEVIGDDHFVSHDNGAAQEQMSDTGDMEDLEEVFEVTGESDLHDLHKQLEHILASLFLKMQMVLHIPESAVQEVIQQLCQINKLSQPLIQTKVKPVLTWMKQHDNVLCQRWTLRTC